jgi:hypothetical protein
LPAPACSSANALLLLLLLLGQWQGSCADASTHHTPRNKNKPDADTTSRQYLQKLTRKLPICLPALLVTGSFPLLPAAATSAVACHPL